ncbi:hypothetical protein AAHE18_20G172200 [Arachis hypogaea]
MPFVFSHLGELWTNFCAVRASAPVCGEKGIQGKAGVVKILSICKCSGCCRMPWFKCIPHLLSSRSSKSRTMFLRSAFSAHVFRLGKLFHIFRGFVYEICFTGPCK